MQGDFTLPEQGELESDVAKSSHGDTALFLHITSGAFLL